MKPVEFAIKHPVTVIVGVLLVVIFGMLSLLPNTVDWPDYDPPENWVPQMDTALDHLDRLPAMAKEELVKALSAAIAHDGKVTVSEAELLRAVCATLHCPLPPFVLSTQTTA